MRILVAEDDPLLGFGHVGPHGLIGGEQGVQVDQVFGAGRPAGAFVHRQSIVGKGAAQAPLKVSQDAGSPD